MSNNNYLVRSQFFACHNCSDVMISSKLWPDLITIFQAKARLILTVGLWAHEHLQCKQKMLIRWTFPTRGATICFSHHTICIDLDMVITIRCVSIYIYYMLFLKIFATYYQMLKYDKVWYMVTIRILVNFFVSRYVSWTAVSRYSRYVVYSCTPISHG